MNTGRVQKAVHIKDGMGVGISTLGETVRVVGVKVDMDGVSVRIPRRTYIIVRSPGDLKFIVGIF